MKSTSQDYGEPWKMTTDFAFDITVNGTLAASFVDVEKATRAIACVNACQGMADPAAEIQAMLVAIKEAHEALSMLDDCRILCADQHHATDATDSCATARAKLQPFITP